MYNVEIEERRWLQCISRKRKNSKDIKQYAYDQEEHEHYNDTVYKSSAIYQAKGSEDIYAIVGGFVVFAA